MPPIFYHSTKVRSMFNKLFAQLQVQQLKIVPYLDNDSLNLGTS